jgi:hypothetical protein
MMLTGSTSDLEEPSYDWKRGGADARIDEVISALVSSSRVQVIVMGPYGYRAAT